MKATEMLVKSELYDRSDIGSQQTIVIVGGGASGSLVAIQLFKRAAQPTRIIIIEPRAALGEGIPYSTTYISHLLNVPAEGMSAFEDDPRHFLRWLWENRGEQVDSDAFVPRALYGHYIRASFSKARQEALRIVFDHFPTRVSRIEIAGSRASVLLDDGQQHMADRVVLATGHQPPGNPMPAGSTVDALSAWTEAAYERLDPASPVLLVGAGLTAVDAVLALDQSGHRGPIHVVSRHGKWPLAHGATTVTMPSIVFEGDPTIRGLLRTLSAIVPKQKGKGRDWRALVDGLRPHTASIWTRLPLSERRCFLRHIRYLWEIHRHRMPLQVAAKLAAMRNTGRLRIYAGRIINAMKTTPSNIRIELRLRSSGDVRRLDVSRVINCTGGESDPAKSKDRMMQNLLANGVAHADPLRLGLMTNEAGALVSADGSVSNIIFAIGSLRRGMLWESTSIPEIRVQAAALADALLESHH